jgi:hypothetical protein
MGSERHWDSHPLAPVSYDRMLKSIDILSSIGPENLSCPHLACLPVDWAKKRRKIVVIGQETCGWGFEEACPADKNVHHQVSTLLEASLRANAVSLLIETYGKFDLAASIPKLTSTPFWRMHRLISDKLCEGDHRSVMWLNVVAVDYCAQGRSSNSMWWNLNWDQVKTVSEWQKGRLREEIKTLSPDVVIFMSGPSYDYYLKAEFCDFEKDEASTEFEKLKLARITDSKSILPNSSYRLYHPGYINRSGNWRVLEDFVSSLKIP